jgi:hypothetical protein
LIHGRVQARKTRIVVDAGWFVIQKLGRGRQMERGLTSSRPISMDGERDVQ